MDINYYRQKLEEEKSTLVEELNSVGVKNREINDKWDSTPSDREEQIETHDEMADRMEDLEEREAAKATLRERLREVNHALKKIDEDKYGLCEISGEKIEEDRLEANPAARTCKSHINDQLPPIID